MNPELRIALKIIVGLLSIMFVGLSGLKCANVNNETIHEVVDDVVELMQDVDKLRDEPKKCLNRIDKPLRKNLDR